MNCEECQPLLEELFDGEADREATPRARAHLATCADCAQAFEELRREQELYLRYEFDAAPAPEAFWSQVIARASTPSATDRQEPVSHAPASDMLARLRAFVGAFAAPRFSPTLTAALVLFAVVLTVVVTRYAERQRQTTQEVAVVVEQRAP
ncbi:MAG TPA: zf-HC2 domain-containing protein, partial [Pyrinomonadaceae bacterium]|nr:zf-HC2 domain-containing protein [Pyrinomonadaceae bacterium]